MGHAAIHVCARCTGIYLGFFIVFVYLVIKKRLSGDKPPGLFFMVFSVSLLLPLMADGFTSYIGVRETRHIKCLYQVSDDDAMNGTRFDDAIANGSYVLDLHHQDKPGITFKYLDGTQRYSRPGYPDERSRWRPETPTDPTFYQVPLRSIIPLQYDNLMVAGRMLDASIIAFSGIRVMVNMNQLGEAAGVTSYLALNQNKSIAQVNCKEVRDTLKKGGSLII